MTLALQRSLRTCAALITLALALALALATALAASTASAQSFDDLFGQGNEAFFRGDYATARARYEALGEAGVDDPDVHFNLGVTHAREGHQGRAIVEFERTLRLRPSDASARAALDASRTIVGQRHAERDGEAVLDAGAPLGEAVFSFLSEDQLAWIVLGLDMLACIALLALFFVRRDRARIALGIAAPILLVLLLATGAGLLSQRGAFSDGPSGVIVADDAILREGPRADAGARGRGLEGERVEVLDRDGAWARVRLSGGREGWVVADDVVEL